MESRTSIRAKREEIESAVRETVEVSRAGPWYIAEAEYNGWKSAAQGASRDSAITTLINKFISRERDERLREEKRELDKRIIETRRELHEARVERMRDIHETMLETLEQPDE